MDAAATGRTSKRSKRLSQPSPHALFNTVLSCLGGMKSALRAQAGHDLAQLRRQDFSGVHRQKLANFHCRPSHAGEIIGNATDVGWGQEKVSHVWSVTARHVAKAGNRHVARNSGCHGPQTHQTRQSARRHVQSAWWSFRSAHVANRDLLSLTEGVLTPNSFSAYVSAVWKVQKRAPFASVAKTDHLCPTTLTIDTLNGDPGRIRTCNLPLRRGLLYPVEPRGHAGAF